MVLRAVVGANSGGGSGTGSFATTTGQPTDNTALASLLNTYAKLASPTFTGAPKAPTAAASSNDTTLASTAFVKTAIAAIVSSGAATWGGVTGTLSNQTDLVAALNAKENSLPAGNSSQYIRGDKTLGTLDANAVGLGNVSNTSDANKPLSNSAVSALALKAPLASPVLTGTVGVPTPAPTSNADVAASTAWVTAKLAALGTGGGFANPMTTQGDMIIAGPNGTPQRVPNGTTGQFLGAGGIWNAVTKANVGLSNVDNTADASKPVSTAQATAIALKAPLVSPAFTGTPTAPTAALGTATGQLATTGFVSNAVANIGSVSNDAAALALMTSVTAFLRTTVPPLIAQ